jgi:hypothetical protein
MGPPSYIRSDADRKFFMQRIPVFGQRASVTSPTYARVRSHNQNWLQTQDGITLWQSLTGISVTNLQELNVTLFLLTADRLPRGLHNLFFKNDCAIKKTSNYKL